MNKQLFSQTKGIPCPLCNGQIEIGTKTNDCLKCGHIYSKNELSLKCKHKIDRKFCHKPANLVCKFILSNSYFISVCNEHINERLRAIYLIPKNLKEVGIKQNYNFTPIFSTPSNRGRRIIRKSSPMS